MLDLDILITTLIKRPYVFAFLISYLFISTFNKGLKKTLLFLISGYFIAWLSEASSIRNGFPYGWYFYLYDNLQGEWMNWGVPVWDSMSYTFLCFAGMSLAEWYYHDPRITTKPTVLDDFKLSLLGAAFVVILDIVIDPLAHQGDKWFLGQIYYYPNPGYYFDVPLSNFAGWFLVAFVIIFLNRVISQKISWFGPDPEKKTFFVTLTGPGLYFGIFVFNWLITLYIGDTLLFFVDIAWVCIPLTFFIKGLKHQKFRLDTDKNNF